MSVTEELWFLIAIGGFLLFMEGAISYIAKKLIKNISEHYLKIISGAILFVLAIIYLLNLPKT